MPSFTACAKKHRLGGRIRSHGSFSPFAVVAVLCWTVSCVDPTIKSIGLPAVLCCDSPVANSGLPLSQTHHDYHQ